MPGRSEGRFLGTGLFRIRCVCVGGFALFSAAPEPSRPAASLPGPVAGTQPRSGQGLRLAACLQPERLPREPAVCRPRSAVKGRGGGGTDSLFGSPDGCRSWHAPCRGVPKEERFFLGEGSALPSQKAGVSQFPRADFQFFFFSVKSLFQFGPRIGEGSRVVRGLPRGCGQGLRQQPQASGHRGVPPRLRVVLHGEPFEGRLAQPSRGLAQPVGASRGLPIFPVSVTSSSRKRLPRKARSWGSVRAELREPDPDGPG